MKSDADIYTIQCQDCNKMYKGKTSHSIQDQIYEYKRDLK